MSAHLNEAVVIREAKRSDLAAMTALIHGAIRQSNSQDYSTDEIEHIIDILSEAHLAEQFERRTILVVLIDDEIVGTASLGEDGDRVHMVFVDPRKHGEGLGTCLLGKIERLASDAGATALRVRSSRSAIDFYTALGFEAEGPEGGEISTTPMIKQLPGRR